MKTFRKISLQIEKAQKELIESIFKIKISASGMLSDDEVNTPCKIMSLNRFALDKCVDYSRSGSSSCVVCKFHQPLRTISESLKKGVMSA